MYSMCMSIRSEKTVTPNAGEVEWEIIIAFPSHNLRAGSGDGNGPANATAPKFQTYSHWIQKLA